MVGPVRRVIIFVIDTDDEAREAEIGLAGVIDGKIARADYSEFDLSKPTPKPLDPPREP